MTSMSSVYLCDIFRTCDEFFYTIFFLLILLQIIDGNHTFDTPQFHDDIRKI